MTTLVHTNLTLNANQFSEIVSCMHQLSSKSPETIGFLKTVLNQFDNSIMTPIEISNCMYGLHNMSTEDDAVITEILSVVTKQLKNNTDSVDIATIGRSLYGLASITETADNKAIVDELLITLSSMIQNATATNTRDACTGVSMALSGLQSLIHSNSSSVGPVLKQCEL